MSSFAAFLAEIVAFNCRKDKIFTAQVAVKRPHNRRGAQVREAIFET
jgi:hypothetical protein